MGAGHGIAAHAHGEGAGSAADIEGVEVGIDATIGPLLACVGKTGRDVSVDRDGGDFFAVVAGHAQGAGRPPGMAVQQFFALEGAEVRGGGIRAGEPEMFLDFAHRGRQSLLRAVAADVVQDLLLALGGFAGHLSSIRGERQGVKRRGKAVAWPPHSKRAGGLWSAAARRRFCSVRLAGERQRGAGSQAGRGFGPERSSFRRRLASLRSFFNCV